MCWGPLSTAPWPQHSEGCPAGSHTTLTERAGLRDPPSADKYIHSTNLLEYCIGVFSCSLRGRCHNLGVLCRMEVPPLAKLYTHTTHVHTYTTTCWRDPAVLHHALRLQTPVSALPKTLHTLPTLDAQTSTRSAHTCQHTRPEKCAEGGPHATTNGTPTSSSRLRRLS